MSRHGPSIMDLLSGKAEFGAHGITILGRKRQISWGWSMRVRTSRYTGAALRAIRRAGQERECERRRRQAGGE